MVSADQLRQAIANSPGGAYLRKTCYLNPQAPASETVLDHVLFALKHEGDVRYRLVD